MRVDVGEGSGVVSTTGCAGVKPELINNKTRKLPIMTTLAPRMAFKEENPSSLREGESNRCVRMPEGELSVSIFST